jgi:ornithine carbamoyltransferase
MVCSQAISHAQLGRGMSGQRVCCLRPRARIYPNGSHRNFVVLNAIETQALPFSSAGIRQPDKGKHFLHIDDWSKDELWQTLQTAQKVKAILKSGDESYKPFAGRTLAMIFTKPSMRTRISFETVSATPSTIIV